VLSLDKFPLVHKAYTIMQYDEIITINHKTSKLTCRIERHMKMHSNFQKVNRKITNNCTLCTILDSYPFQWFALSENNTEIFSLFNQLFQFQSSQHVWSLQSGLCLFLKLFHILLQLLK